MIFSHIVAMSRNRVIGKDNGIPWDLPEDRKYFKRITKDHAVLMGRKTFESIVKFLGKPLPNRKNYVISKSIYDSYVKKLPGTDLPWDEQQVKLRQDLKVDGVYHNIGHALASLKSESSFGSYARNDKNEVFIIGGGEVYNKTLADISKIYLTLIDQDIEGDTFYPEIPSSFKEVSRESFTDPMPYAFIVLERQITT